MERCTVLVAEENHIFHLVLLEIFSLDGFSSFPLILFTSNEIDFGLESPLLLLMLVLK